MKQGRSETVVLSIATPSLYRYVGRWQESPPTPSPVWALTVSLDTRDAISLLAFTWILWLLVALRLPWIHARPGPDARFSTPWPTVLGLLSLVVIVLCMVAGDLLAESVH